MKTQRTPEELLVEAHATVTRLQMKQAKRNASTNPILAPLVTLIENNKKEIVRLQKGLGESPQSFSYRIDKHQLWIDQIEAEEAVAKESLVLETSRKELLASGLASAMATLTASEGSDWNGDVAQVINDLTAAHASAVDEPESLQEARANIDLARLARERLGNQEISA